MWMITEKMDVEERVYMSVYLWMYYGLNESKKELLIWFVFDIWVNNIE